MTTEIDWNLVEETTTESTPVSLSAAEMEKEYSFTFNRVFQTDGGSIGAEVEVADLDGTLLWLSSEEYGPSNGFASMRKAVGGNPDKIEGSTLTYVRVASGKSPTGYAHSWRA